MVVLALSCFSLVTHIAEDNAAFLEDFRLVVVVDLEAREQDLVLVGREGSL